MMNKNRFVEKSIESALDFFKDAIFSEEVARSRGLLQSIPTRIKMALLVVGLVALVGAFRRLPLAYGAYAGCALLLPLSAPATAGSGPLMSLPRFLGVLFPLAMWAGWWLTRGRWQRGRQVVLGVLGLGLLALFSELTTRWLFVA